MTIFQWYSMRIPPFFQYKVGVILPFFQRGKNTKKFQTTGFAFPITPSTHPHTATLAGTRGK